MTEVSRVIRLAGELARRCCDQPGRAGSAATRGRSDSLSPSAGTPGEGRGDGLSRKLAPNPRIQIARRPNWAAIIVTLWAVHAAIPISRATDEPEASSAQPAPEWNAKFDGKTGWIGGDGVYSILLDKDRLLWIFSDSLIGTVHDGRRVDTVLVNNTIAIQNGPDADAPIKFHVGTRAANKPAALITPLDGRGWFWPQAAVRCGDRLAIFLPRIEKTAASG